MLVTEIEVKNTEINLINKKIILIRIMFVLFGLFAALSIAHLIYTGVSKITDYNPYLFSSASLVVCLGWISILFFEYKRFTKFASDVKLNGSAKLTCNQIINLNKKMNSVTISTIVSAVIVMVCFVVTIVVQFIAFNASTLSYIILCGALALFLIYQSINSLINDKMYRNCIFEDSNSNNQIK